MNAEFSTEIFIGFDETDMGGIVFYGNYYRIAHRVIEEFIQFKGLKWQQWFASKEWLVPLRHSEADYLSPLFPGEKYSARVQVLRLGDSSVTFQVEIGPKGKPNSQVRSTHVFVEPKTKKKISIPDVIRKALQ